MLALIKKWVSGMVSSRPGATKIGSLDRGGREERERERDPMINAGNKRDRSESRE